MSALWAFCPALSLPEGAAPQPLKSTAAKSTAPHTGVPFILISSFLAFLDTFRQNKKTINVQIPSGVPYLYGNIANQKTFYILPASSGLGPCCRTSCALFFRWPPHFRQPENSLRHNMPVRQVFSTPARTHL